MSIERPEPGVEIDFEPDTEDITLETKEAAWEALAEAYADGKHCPGCLYDERGWNPYTNRQWRECRCIDPRFCPAMNSVCIPAFLRRQGE